MTVGKRLYVTTPLYYVNAEPHLGSAYTMIITDTIVRFYRLRGVEVYYQTGTDEHGDKIAHAAAAAGKEPKEFVDQVAEIFRRTWLDCGIRFDHFIRTTDAPHVAYVQDVLKRVEAKGDVYFGSYSGRYCVGCERFYTEKELVEGKCPDHNTTPALIEEKNYFFRMGRYQEALVRHIREHPDFIRPERYRNEVLAMLREPLEDLCISRPKSRLTWGIELPFDSSYVTYVWFDALINYVSGLRQSRGEDFNLFWPETQHFIAKDILKPHAVYWPTMLMSAGLPLYRHLNVHGYWTVSGQKMSKTLGNVVSPMAMKRRYGMDAFRYFLLRESVFGLDADFREEALVTRLNADLANGLGNLVSRTLSMQQRYFGGEVQPLDSPLPADVALREAFEKAAEEVENQVGELMLSRALEAVWRAIDRANKYIVETAPFSLVKDKQARPRVGAILHRLLECLRFTAELVSPFMPETGERMFTLLGLDPSRLRVPAVPWGNCFNPGQKVQKPVSLFPRVESTGSGD